jgi:hypothetical protein
MGASNVAGSDYGDTMNAQDKPVIYLWIGMTRLDIKLSCYYTYIVAQNMGVCQSDIRLLNPYF